MSNRASASGEKSENMEQPAQPTSCAGGCGFFANEGCGGYCSLCYKTKISADVHGKQKCEVVAKEFVVQPPPSATVAKPRSPPPPKAARELRDTSAACSPTANESTVADAATPSVALEDGRPPQKNLSRCFACNKKVGFTGFKCRCGYVFCGAHRHAEAHNCSFDFKGMQRQNLAAANPIVTPTKVEKI